jgi:hypothetical protein
VGLAFCLQRKGNQLHTAHRRGQAKEGRIHGELQLQAVLGLVVAGKDRSIDWEESVSIWREFSYECALRPNPNHNGHRDQEYSFMSYIHMTLCDRSLPQSCDVTDTLWKWMDNSSLRRANSLSACQRKSRLKLQGQGGTLFLQRKGEIQLPGSVTE